MRAIALLLLVCLSAAAGQPACSAEALCVLKHFSGQVRVTDEAGRTQVAQPGALSEGQVLLLDRGALATLNYEGESFELKGPLTLPISRAGLADMPSAGGGGMLALLAGLLSRLSDSGAYSSGAARADDGDSDLPFCLLGPRGTLLTTDWRFQPLGQPSKLRLSLRCLDRPAQLEFSLETTEQFNIGGLDGASFEYVYRSDDPAAQGGWPPVRFDVLCGPQVDAAFAALADLDTPLKRVVWLADAGYIYDAWQAASLALEEGETGGSELLLRSLCERLGDTLLEMPAEP